MKTGVRARTETEGWRESNDKKPEHAAGRREQMERYLADRQAAIQRDRGGGREP